MIKIFKEMPLILGIIFTITGFSFTDSAIAYGGFILWTCLGLILITIISVAFRIAHHAEILAIRFGEPYGTLILTVAAVSVEVVILAIMLSSSPNPTLARDTVFSAFMFDINGILGLAAIIGGMKHGSPKYNFNSANSYIAMLLVSIGIGMFLPVFIPNSLIVTYSMFSIGIMSIMYIAFLRLQTVEHFKFFEYFSESEEEAHDLTGSPNGLHVFMLSSSILLVGLLSEIMSKLLDAGLEGSSLPKSIPAILIALISASPEILIAMKAAKEDKMQTTINIALGASLATVLLTVPVIEFISLLNHQAVIMAITPLQGGFLLLTFATLIVNLHDGETNIIEGISHFGLFLSFIILVALGLI